MLKKEIGLKSSQSSCYYFVIKINTVGEFLEDAILEEEIELSEEVNDIDEVEEIEEIIVKDADVRSAEDLVVKDKNQRSWLESDESDEDED